MPDNVLTVDWTPLPELMNDIPYRMVWDKHRYIISRGGSSSGKSVGIAQNYVFKISAYPGRNLLVLRNVGDTNRKSTYNEICKAIYSFNLKQLFTIRDSDLTITCINGNQIIFGGLDDVQKVKSTTFKRGILTDIWIEEASETKESDFEELDLRLRGISETIYDDYDESIFLSKGIKNHFFQMILSFNPIDSMHWLKGRFYDNKDDRASCYLSTYKDNRWCDEETKKNMEILKTKNSYLYQVYACGEWGNAGDIVFQNARYERCPYKEEA